MTLEIKESKEELYKMLSEQKTASGKERVQALYLLKSKQVKTIGELPKILGRKRITIRYFTLTEPVLAKNDNSSDFLPLIICDRSPYRHYSQVDSSGNFMVEPLSIIIK